MSRIQKQDSRFDRYLSTLITRFNATEDKAKRIASQIDDYNRSLTDRKHSLYGFVEHWPKGVLRRKRVAVVKARLHNRRLQTHMVRVSGPHWGLPRDATVMRLRMNGSSGVGLNALPRIQHTHSTAQSDICIGCAEVLRSSSRINITGSKNQANSSESTSAFDSRAPISLTRGKPNGKRARPRESTRFSFICRHCGVGLVTQTGTHLRPKTKKVCAGKGSV